MKNKKKIRKKDKNKKDIIVSIDDKEVTDYTSLLSILDKKGVCAICLYPGHKEGKVESEKVLEYVKGLNQKEFEVLKYEFINQVNEPPFLIAIEKR